MRLVFLLFMSFIEFSCHSQTKNDTIYYTSNWTRTSLKKVMSIYGVKDYDSTGRGLATYYRKNGTLHSLQNEYNDLKEGYCVWYHENGKKYAEGNYLNDKAEGEINFYDTDEKLVKISTYKNDTLIKSSYYNPLTGLVIPGKENITQFPEIEATFPGGGNAMQKWISENIIYPTQAIELNQQGKVYVRFIVEKDGSINEVEVVKGSFEDLNNEAIRVIESMPNWTPAQSEGEYIRTMVTIPINFNIQDDMEGKKTKKRKR